MKRTIIKPYEECQKDLISKDCRCNDCIEERACAEEFWAEQD